MTDTRPMVTLSTGEVVDSWSPLWKAECLARHVAVIALLRIASVEARRARLASIEAERGAVFAQRVKDDFAQAWAEARAQAQPEREKAHD